jgi:hypothetical protein
MTAARVPRHPEAFSRDSSLRQRRPRVTAAKHLDWIRTLPCVLTLRSAEAAHIRFADPRFAKRSTGIAERPDDKWAVPLSPEMHRLHNDSQHNRNEREFWRSHGIDPCLLAAALWINSGDDDAAGLILREARARRT